MLGNCINIAGQGTYNIQGFTSTSIITVDRTLGTFSTTSGHEGGPILSLGHLCGLMVGGNVAFFKADGTFTITSASSNADAGVCTAANGTLLVGYTSSRTAYNTDAPPTIQTNVSTATMFTGSNSGYFVFNFILDGNTQTAAKAVNGGTFINTTFKNFNTASTNVTVFYNAYMTANSAAVFNGGSAGSLCVYCSAVANTSTPYVLTSGACFNCIGRGNTGTTDAFSITGGQCFNCTAATSGRDGFHITGASTNTLITNSYAESNVVDGYNIVGATSTKMFLALGYYNNMTNIVTTTGTVLTTALTPAASVFVSSTNLNLNNTANAGTLLRAVALPSVFLDGATTNFRDIGASQHQDPAQVNVTVGIPIVQ
jgi:hypothetical protein